MYIIILAYLLLYIIPIIILDILQMRHIQSYAQKKPVILNEQDYQIAANYAITKSKLNIISHLFDFIILLIWLQYGITHLMEFCNTHIENEFLQNWLAFLCFIGINAILQIPFSLVSKRIDTHYGFNKQNFLSFFIDTLKMFIIGGIFIGILVALLLWVMQTITLWWVAGFLLLFGFIILIQLIYPTIIAPLFNKFTPLQDEILEKRINALMQEVGFKSNGIFVMDASKRDGRLNAYFGGLGSSKRVVLFDTLLDKINPDGLIAILGHELGHFKHHDIIHNILTSSLILFSMFALIGLFFESLCIFLGLPYSNSTLLILALLLLPPFSFLISPIQSYFSRKAEYRADEFGASCASKKALSDALVCLVNENKAFPHSHPAYIFFYYSHPPLIERLKALEEFNDRN